MPTNTEKRFVFVVGCGHSGTSLMAAMLGAHTEIHSINFETNAFAENGALGAEMLQKTTATADKPIICEKTPTHIYHVPLISASLPGSRFIKMVRDPRDVACSIKRRYKDLSRGIARWNADNSVPIDDRSDTQVVHYEELVSDPDAVLGKVCEHIGVKFEFGMLEYWKDERDWFGVSERQDTDGAAGKNHAVRRNWQIHQPLTAERVGVYARELTAIEIKEVVCLTAPKAVKYGYVF